MSGPQPSFHPSPGKPKLRLPNGACDSHVHVFGPAGVFPYAKDAPFVPADAPKGMLFAMHARLGIEHCVIVQSTCHGYDNSVTADAIKAKNGAYCGIALAPTTVDDVELKRLDKQGFRGLRFNFMPHLGSGPRIEDVIAFGARLAPLEMHLQLHFESSLIHEVAPWLRKSAVPVMIDHMGRMDAEFGHRTFWGTDWPHPNLDHVPDDGQLADLLSEIAPTDAQRQALLVDNPRRFYRYLPALS